jgi:hypothetical protein
MIVLSTHDVINVVAADTVLHTVEVRVSGSKMRLKCYASACKAG